MTTKLGGKGLIGRTTSGGFFCGFPKKKERKGENMLNRRNREHLFGAQKRPTMVLLLDGNSAIGAHALRKLRNFICLRHLFVSTVVSY